MKALGACLTNCTARPGDLMYAAYNEEIDWVNKSTNCNFNAKNETHIRMSTMRSNRMHFIRGSGRFRR